MDYIVLSPKEYGPYPLIIQGYAYQPSCHNASCTFVSLTPPIHIERNEISGGMPPTVDVYCGAVHTTVRRIF